jgi:glucose/mannose-6-phosphate isomerase
MREAIAGLPDQLRWAAEVDAPTVEGASEILVCGMGGSAISGDYLAALTAETGKRVTTHRGYGLPRWSPHVRPLVLAVSYSGDTEETLSAIDRAAEWGLPVGVVASGGELIRRAREAGWPAIVVPPGHQPRAALGYLLGGAARLAACAGVLPGIIDELLEAAEVVAGLLDTGAAPSLARDLAGVLDGRIPVVYGAVGPTAPVAMRWKTQINENGKWPAWWSLLPEADHNEVVGWAARPDLSRRVGLVALRDRLETPETARRFEATMEVTAADVDWVGEVWSQGESTLARMMSLTVVGDLVSVELAESAGVDPTPVEVIERLKRLLKEGD